MNCSESLFMHIHYEHNILISEQQITDTNPLFDLAYPCTKGMRMNCSESLFMHIHYEHNILISEQQITDTNPLFDLAYIPRDLQHIP